MDDSYKIIFKNGGYGAIFGVGMCILSSTSFPFNIPVLVILGPFIQSTAWSNIFLKHVVGGEWFSTPITFFGGLLLIFIGFIMGMLIGTMRKKSQKIFFILIICFILLVYDWNLIHPFGLQ